MTPAINLLKKLKIPHKLYPYECEAHDDFGKHAATQLCNNCALYQGKAADAAGGCPLFAGKQVAGKGWCSAWAKKA